MAVFEQKKSTKVTLDDTVPLSCTIETAQNVKDHTVSSRQMFFDNYLDCGCLILKGRDMTSVCCDTQLKSSVSRNYYNVILVIVLVTTLQLTTPSAGTVVCT